MKRGGRASDNRVRIIGGEWRSRLIRFPDLSDLRPTPDRVRETLFNWLGQDLTGLDCLDLFAGSGVLGFEAASRGARSVVMVERNAQAFTALQEAARELQAQCVQLVRGDALQFISTARAIYDVVFLDPPYRDEVDDQLFVWLAPRLHERSLVYLEGAQTARLPAGWLSLRHGRAGAVHYQLLGVTSGGQSGLSGDVRSDHEGA